MSAPVSLLSWLRANNLEQWHSQLASEGVELSHIPELTDEDLKSLGMPLGPRKVFLKAASTTRNVPCDQSIVHHGEGGIQVAKTIELLKRIIVQGKTINVVALRGRIADVFSPERLVREQRGLVLMIQSGLPDDMLNGRPVSAFDLLSWVDRLNQYHCMDKRTAFDLASAWNQALGGAEINVEQHNISQVCSREMINDGFIHTVDNNTVLRHEDLLKPKWASSVGSDQYGYWAEIDVFGAIQRMRLIVSGSCVMGTPTEEQAWARQISSQRGDPEVNDGLFSTETQHRVTITTPLWLADTTVSQQIWKLVMKENPSHFQDNSLNPVDSVSWNDCELFLRKLNGVIRGLNADFPTEAQWEYACRAGTTSRFWTGDNPTGLRGAAKILDWVTAKEFPDIARNKPIMEMDSRYQAVAPIGSFRPNPWGLYDMHGNVSEWTRDWYDYYPEGPVQDPTGPSTGSLKICRGGSWAESVAHARSGCRNAGRVDERTINRGFRFAAPFR